MKKSLVFSSAAFLIALSLPAKANFVIEPTFEQKMAESELVVIGTVTAVSQIPQGEVGSTASISVLRMLKGQPRDVVTIRTYSPVAELNPRCCELGATYILFLSPWARDGVLGPIAGRYGAARVGGPPGRELVVCPTDDERSCPPTSP